MTKQTNSLKLASRSVAGRRCAWAMVIASFALCVGLGSVVRLKEENVRAKAIIQTAKSLAGTILIAGTDNSDDLLLKVNDLINLETVLGIRLLQGTETPLSVGETDISFITGKSNNGVETQWDEMKTKLDIALDLPLNLPYSQLVLRLDAEKIMPPPFMGTLINWVAAPLIALMNGLLALWIFGHYFLRPLSAMQTYFEENNGKYALASVPQALSKRSDETGTIAQHIETLRVEVNTAKAKIESQVRFLHETPYPLLRCSVNRKVLYANVAAKSEAALFGDESKEFVSPALSELVRKAFYEAKQVHGDIRCAKTIRKFRAIPVLEAGYVNLYGEDAAQTDQNDSSNA